MRGLSRGFWTRGGSSRWRHTAMPWWHVSAPRPWGSLLVTGSPTILPKFWPFWPFFNPGSQPRITFGKVYCLAAGQPSQIWDCEPPEILLPKRGAVKTSKTSYWMCHAISSTLTLGQVTQIQSGDSRKILLIIVEVSFSYILNRPQHVLITNGWVYRPTFHLWPGSQKKQNSFQHINCLRYIS